MSTYHYYYCYYLPSTFINCALTGIGGLEYRYLFFRFGVLFFF